jgi:hypothetical protein
MNRRSGVKRRSLGRVGNGLINQQDGYVIPNWVDPVTLPTLETLPVVFEHQRLLAERTDQDVEQVLGDHGGEIVRPCSAAGNFFATDLRRLAPIREKALNRRGRRERRENLDH